MTPDMTVDEFRGQGLLFPTQVLDVADRMVASMVRWEVSR